MKFKHAAMMTVGLLIGWILTGQPARAVIQVLIPLKTLIEDSDSIFLAKVEKIDPAKPSAVFIADKSLKGQIAFERIPVNLTGDKEKHTPQLLKRLAIDLPVVICVKKQGPGKHMILAFSNGTWFQVLGQADGQQTRWAFTHCETYLRRTFKGTTAELEQIIANSLAGKSKPPVPNANEPPGFGPEIAATKP